MRWAGVIFAGLSGCSALFDLSAPVRERDGSIDDASEDAPRSDALPDVMVDGPACPSNYMEIGNRRYRLATNNASWTNAATDCADDGVNTHLAVISNSAELTLVNATYSMENEVWIGLSDLVTDGTFLWVTVEDTMGYPPASGAPWQNLGTDPCVILKVPDGLNTKDCGLNKHYLCECDTYADDPSRY